MKKPSFAFVFLVLLSVMGICSIMLPQATISKRENRELQQFPALSLPDIADGTYQSALEEACKDHIVWREDALFLHAQILKNLGMRRMNDVWIGKERLFQVTTPPDRSAYQQLGEQLNQFAAAHANVRFDFLLVPGSDVIYANEVPFKDATQQRREDIAWFTSLLSPTYHKPDCIKIMDAQKEKELYYRGDHHWTTLGAYTLFQEWQNMRGYTDAVRYVPHTINNAFYGTLSNASGVDVRDHIEIYEPKDLNLHVIVDIVQEQKRMTSVYAMEKQFSANPYEVFFNGNYDRIDIKTTAVSDRTLLVVKDSYANCFVPFLLPYYHRIIMIDPRYDYESLQDLMEQESISDVMFLFYANTFFQDTSLHEWLNQ